jgi:hypothetical protein
VNKLQKQLGNSSGCWVALALLAAAILPIVSALAEGTPAGTQIRNQATGTFEDPNNPGIPIQIDSNEVIVTVAEVAGITVQANGVTEADGNSDIEVGDLLYFQFEITNVGNDPTRFRIPNSANVSGPGTISGNLQISLDGGTTWIDVTGANFLTGSVAADQSILVRVPVVVDNTATEGDEIVVQLGNTPGDAQNQPRSADTTDVYTEDNPDGGEPASGSPVNGVREASSTQRITVSNVPQALALLTKTHADPVATNNATDPSDDVITYQLALEILSSIPAGSSGFVPDDLVATSGTNITVDGALVQRILVSDAIPAGTQLEATSWQAPDGWQVVFANTATSTNALAAEWNTDVAAVGGAANVTRIGFIFNGTLTKGTKVTGFEFAVRTTGITSTTTIANVAQVFGGSNGNPDRLIYDESGDNNPNNFNDDGTSGPVDENGDPIVGTGVPNLETDGQDAGNDNSGTGPGGEANVVIIEAPGDGILNGPQGSPNAVGPDNANNDFSNTVSTATIPASGTPPPANFVNTIENTTGEPILLLPTTPEDPNSLPAGTTVTISYGGRSVTYVYDPVTGFTSSDPPISIPGTETTADYAVTIQLPSAEPLQAYPVPITAFVDRDGDGQPSPGEPANTTINRIYTGFVKVLKESRLLQGSGPAVLSGQETFSTDMKTPGSGNIVEYRFTYTNISLAGGPGNRTLSAENFTIVEDGTTYDPVNNPSGNNWALDNDNSDGDDDPKTAIDSSHVVGSAADSTGGVVVFFNNNPPSSGIERSGTTAGTDVTRYEVQLQRPLAPEESGTFTFRRQVN